MTKSNMADYINGTKNTVKEEMIISREKCDRTNNEFVYVQPLSMDEPLYMFWYKRGHGSAKPKHTGGKKPYVMLMIDELIRLIDSGISAEHLGSMIRLTPYIEWGTGRLLYGREKRSMRVKDMMKVLGKKERTTFNIISRFKKHGLLSYKDGSYFISRSFIKRGAKSEN